MKKQTAKKFTKEWVELTLCDTDPPALNFSNISQKINKLTDKC